MAVQIEQIPTPLPMEGRGPTLATLHEIELILRQAEEPLSLNEIKRRMKAKAVRHETVRLAIEEFKRLGFVVEGSKGVLWTLNLSPTLWKKGRWQRL